MMERLYEENPFLTAFDAVVESCVQGKKGYDIILNHTAFYPEGGGQPYDTGVLGGVKVLEVHTRDGRVVHTCDGPLEEGSTVSGKIDWERRFDLMQQHSGEHMVSGMAHDKWGCENVGFHLGAEAVTIDLSLPLTPEQLRELEEDVNRYIWEDHPIEITYPSHEELASIPYRSKKELTGQVRIVTFPGADCCACCGTHVSSSGQVGLVKFLSAEKFREGVRVQLLCGGRALRHLNGVWEQNAKISHLLSAKVLDTAPAVERLLEEHNDLKARRAALEDAAFARLAEEYRGAGDVLLFQEGLTPDGLRRLCDAVLHTCAGRCACFSGSEAEGYKYAMGQAGGDLRALTKEMNQALNGRGGGKPDFVQGSLRASQAEIRAFFEK